MACPACGNPVPEGARFCPSCGAAMHVPSDERRVVSVLFGDVVGFTSLAETRDPEQVKNLMDRCFERLVADITAFGGRVDKIVGDGILALFGAPVAHEDDPERAVRAALRMQETLEAHAGEVGAPLRMRIAVNTGEVLVGALRAAGDVTAMGDVVNTASRLQSAARPGQVIVGPETYAATREAIRYDSLGPLQARGRDATVEGWAAVAPLGPPGVRRRRTKAPLVGRKAEIGMLWHSLGTAFAHRRPHLVLLLGEAGVGKTRLVEELAEIARGEHEALVLEGRCVPYGEANVWWPVAEALRQACDIAPDDEAAVAMDKCRAAVAALLQTVDAGEADRVADGLLYLMGYEAKLHDLEPARAREEAFRSLWTCLQAIATNRPIVLVLSELHWADELVLDFLDRLFERLRDLPVVVAATARPELDDRWTPRPGRHNLMVLHLDPLEPQAAGNLMAHLAGREVPADLRSILIERSGGNPLFLEELVALLSESGMLEGRDGYPAELPATLRGLVAARIDALSREERSMLEDAAVGGRTGPVDIPEALARERGEDDPARRLEALAAKDLLGIRDGRYEFRSDLVRDVAYETLTKGERARRHARLGSCLEKRAKASGREDEYLEQVAHHYGSAAELVAELGVVDGAPSDLRERALTWLTKAASRAEDRETPGVCVHLYDQALRLTGDGPHPDALHLRLGRAKARAAVRDLEGGRIDAEAVMTEARSVGDDRACAQALTVVGDIETKETAYAQAAETLARAVEAWRSLGDRSGEADALRLLGMTSMFRGDHEEAEGTIAEALAAFRSVGDRRGEAWCLQNLAWSSFYQGEYSRAEERLHRSVEVFQEIGDFGGLGWAFGLLGYVAYFKGDLATAETLAERGVEWTREMGDRWAEGMMITLLSNVRLWTGRTQEAVELATRAGELFESIDDRFGRVQAGIALSFGLVLGGRIGEALETTQRIGELAENLDQAMKSLAHVQRANITTMIGDGAEALAWLAEDSKGREIDAAHVTAAEGLALLQVGRAEEATRILEDAVDVASADGSKSRALGTLAMAAACAGRVEQALAAVSAQDEVGGGTYVDRVLGRIGAGLAEALRGDGAAAEKRFAQAEALLADTGDVLNQAIAGLAHAYVLRLLGDDAAEDRVASARERLERIGAHADGWDAAFRQVAEGGATTVPG